MVREQGLPFEVKFQSTPPRREVTVQQEALRAYRRISIHTSPKGGDEFELPRATIVEISIHTSPKGGDDRAVRTRRPPEISIHTSPKGGDLVITDGGMFAYKFQSTPPRREVTHSRQHASIGGDISIHTSPKGGDACKPSAVPRRTYFNPHLPEGR